MKNIKNNIKLLVAAAATAMGVTSCSLDMLPLNDVVLENFWTNRDDVESVVASCYQATKEGNYISNMIVWGEGRSDNVDVGSTISSSLNSIMKGSLKTTNFYCDWASYYNVINRCNTVLHYAPSVAEKDPNYTESDLRINIAECKFLRAYSYLTLIKTFKNVPFTLDPTIDDSQDFLIPQTSFEDILDALIADIESCKDDAPRRYSEVAFNTGKITRVAMYSLLAELYLWKASDYQLAAEEKSEAYRRCIEACDEVIRFKRQQYLDRERDINGIDVTRSVDENVWKTFGYPLMSIKATNGFSEGYGAIFGDCRSYESIFEIPFQYRSYETNTAVASMYGYYPKGSANLVQNLTANQNLMQSIPTAAAYNDKDLFPVPTDYRSLLSFSWVEATSFQINKYVVLQPTCSYVGNGTIEKSAYDKSTQIVRSEEMQYESWIIYRLPEIMLFRAEAEIELAGLTDAGAVAALNAGYDYRDGATLVGNAPALYADAHNIITAVYLRSNPAALSSSGPGDNAPKLSASFGLEASETYLMNERRREFLFEAKRYYDLVRQARREGNTQKFSTAIASKFSGGEGSLKMKMKMMDFMYMPIYKGQMEVNPNLIQNSAYADEEETVKN